MWLLATLTRIIPQHKCQQFPVPHYRLGRLVCRNGKPTYSKTLLSLPMSLWLLATLTRIIPPHKCQQFPVPHYRLGRLVCRNGKPTYSKTLLSLPMSLWLRDTLTRIIPQHKCQQFPVPHYRLGRLVCWNGKPTYSPSVCILRHYWVCPCLYTRPRPTQSHWSQHTSQFLVCKAFWLSSSTDHGQGRNTLQSQRHLQRNKDSISKNILHDMSDWYRNWYFNCFHTV